MKNEIARDHLGPHEKEILVMYTACDATLKIY